MQHSVGNNDAPPKLLRRLPRVFDPEPWLAAAADGSSDSPDSPQPTRNKTHENPHPGFLKLLQDFAPRDAFAWTCVPSWRRRALKLLIRPPSVMSFILSSALNSVNVY